MKNTGKTINAVSADRIKVLVSGFTAFNDFQDIHKGNSEKEEKGNKTNKAENIQIQHLICFKIDI